MFGACFSVFLVVFSVCCFLNLHWCFLVFFVIS